MRDDLRSAFARVTAQHEAKKAAREAEEKQAEQIGTSPERGTVIPNKEGEENKQGRRNLAASLKPMEQPSPVRVQPRPKNKLQGTTEAVRTSVEQIQK